MIIEPRRRRHAGRLALGPRSVLILQCAATPVLQGPVDTIRMEHLAMPCPDAAADTLRANRHSLLFIVL